MGGFFAKDADDLAQSELRLARKSATKRQFRITLPSSQGFISFAGFVKQAEMSLGVDKVIDFKATIKVSGEVSII